MGTRRVSNGLTELTRLMLLNIPRKKEMHFAILRWAWHGGWQSKCRKHMSEIAVAVRYQQEE
jgi:hypothetical protein